MIKSSELIKDKTNKDLNLASPDVIFHTHIFGKNGYFMVDFSGIDLSKREYRIFTHPAALKGTVAYSLIRLAGYQRKDSLLDPFTKSGIIPIEAAIYSTKTPINNYRKEALAFNHLKTLESEDIEGMFRRADKEITDAKAPIIGIDSTMPSVTAAQKNAKLAGVNKSLSLSRIELEWLDTKFGENEIDKIVCSPPEESKRLNPKFIEKLYKELFYQAGYILSSKGTATFLVRDTSRIKVHAAQSKFETKSEYKISIGEEQLTVITLSRS